MPGDGGFTRDPEDGFGGLGKMTTRITWRSPLAAVAAACVVLLSLAGCGVIGSKYTYIEWYAHYFEPYYTRWFSEFEAEHADQNVRIRFRSIANNAGEITYTMMISQTMCDVISVSSGTDVLLLENPVLEPLDETYLDSDDLPPQSVNMARQFDGEIVGFPHTINMRPFIYYNKAILEEAGTTAGEAPETFDEYRQWAAKLFKWKVDGREILGPLTGEAAAEARIIRRPFAMMRGFIWAATPILISRMDPLPDENGVSDRSLDDYLGGPPSGRPFRFDSPEFIEGMHEYQKFYLPRKSAVADGDVTRVPAFKSGVYAGCEGSNWIYEEASTVQMAATRMPHPPGREAMVWFYSSSIGVSKDSKNKQLALEFAKFITTADTQADAYYGHGYLPVRYSAWDRLEADAAADTHLRETLLAAPEFGRDPYVGQPRIKRRNHDEMDIYLWVPRPRDGTLLEAICRIDADGTPGEVEVVGQGDFVAAGVADRAEGLARDACLASGQNVRVIVQGKPEEMIPYRSWTNESPLAVYRSLLDKGFYIPVNRLWYRLTNEVIRRACQFVTRVDDPMTPEEAAAWAQTEAEDIMSGRK